MYKISEKNDSLVDRVLIDRLISGDEEAFSIFFSAYYTDLVVFASGFTHESFTAEEIVQDTFVNLWENHENLGIRKSVKSFLLKSVQNRCIDWYRHQRIKQKHEREVINNTVLSEYDTDNYILCSELKEKINKAFHLVPSECAEAFRMSRDEGLKYHEIAEKLNVSIRTVEVRICKALRFFHEYLKDYKT